MCVMNVIKFNIKLFRRLKQKKLCDINENIPITHRLILHKSKCISMNVYDLTSH